MMEKQIELKCKKCKTKMIADFDLEGYVQFRIKKHMDYIDGLQGMRGDNEQ